MTSTKVSRTSYDNGERLIDLARFDLTLEPIYYNQGLWCECRLLLRESMVVKLLRAQRNISPFKFKIWDAWRSLEVQEKLYNLFFNKLQKENQDWSEKTIHDEVKKFVWDPENALQIPPHLTGGAVDLTIIDKSGNELNMGTGFDHFGPEALPGYFDSIDQEISKNRQLLFEVLRNEELIVYKEEWWHFDYGNWRWAAALNMNNPIYEETAP